MAEQEKSKVGHPRNLGRLTEAQDSALDRGAREMTKRRGTTVTRADLTREALARYFRDEALEWPC